MYFLYLSKMFQSYHIIKILYGSYISYNFLKWVFRDTYSGFIWKVMSILKPNSQIDDKYKNIKLVDDYILIME